MRKYFFYLFAAFAICSIAFTSCEGGPNENEEEEEPKLNGIEFQLLDAYKQQGNLYTMEFVTGTVDWDGRTFVGDGLWGTFQFVYDGEYPQGDFDFNFDLAYNKGTSGYAISAYRRENDNNYWGSVIYELSDGSAITAYVCLDGGVLSIKGNEDKATVIIKPSLVDVMSGSVVEEDYYYRGRLSFGEIE